ncbi:hypothetical protein [Pseudomonas sp. TWR1-1-4]|uniref:hypothetical protein n=1 Tax=Pseudomonas sp. TWR1-1-4 TaxID=2804604 RepID=UPI003CE9FA75
MKRIENIILVILATSLLIPIGILCTYSFHLSGEISSSPSDWGNFGSVLGGAFTLLGGLATSLTLIFLYKQQKANERTQAKSEKNSKNFQLRQVAVIQKQIASLTFEQYKNHRAHFIETLEKEGNKNNILFRDIEKLYHSIFQKNRPTHCEFFVDLEHTGENSNPLFSCVSTLAKIQYQLIHAQEFTSSSNIAKSIFQITKNLNIYSSNSEILGGELIIDSQKSGIYIHNFEIQIRKLQNIIDQILFFSGNDTSSPSYFPENELHLVNALIKISAEDDISFTLTEEGRGAIGLYRIRQITETQPHLKELHEYINKNFSSVKVICEHLQISSAQHYGQIIAREIRNLGDVEWRNAAQEISEIKKILVTHSNISPVYL